MIFFPISGFWRVTFGVALHAPVTSPLPGSGCGAAEPPSIPHGSELPSASAAQPELPGARCSAEQVLKSSRSYFYIYGKRWESSVCRY